MTDNIEGRPPLSPQINQDLTPRPRLTFGVDAPPPDGKPISKTAAKAAGAHDFISQPVKSIATAEDLVLQIQDLTQPIKEPATEAESTIQHKVPAQSYDRPLQPGDPFHVRKGQVLYDAEGKEVGTYDQDNSSHTFVRYIRRPNSAPLVVHSDQNGNEIITKMIGSSRVMGSR